MSICLCCWRRSVLMMATANRRASLEYPWDRRASTRAHAVGTWSVWWTGRRGDIRAASHSPACIFLTNLTRTLIETTHTCLGEIQCGVQWHTDSSQTRTVRPQQIAGVCRIAGLSCRIWQILAGSCLLQIQASISAELLHVCACVLGRLSIVICVCVCVTSLWIICFSFRAEQKVCAILRFENVYTIWSSTHYGARKIKIKGVFVKISDPSDT